MAMGRPESAPSGSGIPGAGAADAVFVIRFSFLLRQTGVVCRCHSMPFSRPREKAGRAPLDGKKKFGKKFRKDLIFPAKTDTIDLRLKRPPKVHKISHFSGFSGLEEVPVMRKNVIFSQIGRPVRFSASENGSFLSA
jgi:hypothetical protein